MAKVETEVSVKINVDNSEANKKIEELKAKLKLASDNLANLKNQFNANSEEVKKAEAEVFSLTEAIANIKPVEVSVQDNQAIAQVDELKKEIGSITSKEIELKADNSEAIKSIDEVNKDVSNISSKEINIDVNNANAVDSINVINSDLDSISSKEVSVNVDNKDAIGQIDKLNTELDSISSKEINVGVDTNDATKKIETLNEEVNSISSKEISINADTKNATDKIKGLNNEVNSVSSKEVSINANTDVANEKINSLNNEINSVSSKEISVNANTQNATDNINALNDEVNNISSKEVSINANTENANEKINSLNEEIGGISSKEISINADVSDAESEINKITEEVDLIEDKNIEITANGSEAITEIDYVNTDLSKIPEEKKIVIDTENKSSLTIGELNDKLKQASANVETLKLKFGENSKEVKLAEAEVSKLNDLLANPKTSDKPEGAVKSLKQQLKEAQLEVISLQEKFGDTSTEAVNAAKKVAGLKDQIKGAKDLTELFNPEKKFQAFAGALQSVTGGFAAVQGAQALFGNQSKDLEKTLVKVQGALALSQGLNQIVDAKNSFKELGAVMKTIPIVQKAITYAQWLWNAAMDANPIGAIIAAITLLITGIATLTSYLISSSNAAKAQAKSVAESTKALEQQSKVLERNNQQFEIAQNQKLALAKANGESAESIRKLELKLADEKIAFEISARAIAQNTLEKERNKLATLKAQDADEDLINKQLENVNKAVEGYNTENKKVQSAYDERTAIVNKHIVEVAQEQTNAKNKEAEERKKALEKEKSDRDAANKERIANDKAANEELLKLKQQNSVEELKTEREKAYKKLEIDNENEGERINAENISNQLKLKLLNENSIAYQNEKRKLDEQFAKEDEAKQTEYLNKLNELKEQIKIDGIKNEFDKELEVINDNYRKQYAEIEKNENYNAEQKLALKKQLQIKEQTEIDLVEQKRSENLLNRQLTELDAIIKNSEEKISARKEALKQEEILEKEALEKGLITKEEYKNKEKELEKEKTKIAEEEAKTRIDIANSIADSLGKLSDLVGKQTAVGKGLAVAQATINTFLGATEVIKQKSVLPEPVATISKVVNVATIIASGIKSVKEILKVKVEGAGGSGGSGGSVPNASAITPPITPQAQTTTLNQNQINQLSSATTRAFVVESDVSGSQERIQRLNRAARIN